MTQKNRTSFMNDPLPNDIKWFRLSNLKVRKVKVLLFSSIVLSVKKERFFSH